MNRFNARLCKILLPALIKSACPGRIPRSGEKGKQVNCFVVSVDNQGEPYLLVTGINKDVLDCREWNGNSYSIEKSINLADVTSRDLFITHYYGLSTILYSGIIDLAISRFTLIPYGKVRLHDLVERFDQYFFNKKKLVTKQRIDLLRLLISRHQQGKNSFEAFELMTELYSIKWVLHPEGDSQLRKVDFFLSSLSDTGELLKIGQLYALTGHALKAIEEYEEQERRHTDNVKVQRLALWLTVAIVLLTAAQAGLFKLPTLLDMSNVKLGWPW